MTISNDDRVARLAATLPSNTSRALILSCLDGPNSPAILLHVGTHSVTLLAVVVVVLLRAVVLVLSTRSSLRPSNLSVPAPSPPSLSLAENLPAPVGATSASWSSRVKGPSRRTSHYTASLELGAQRRPPTRVRAG